MDLRIICVFDYYSFVNDYHGINKSTVCLFVKIDLKNGANIIKGQLDYVHKFK